jgi:hypothetical protein
MLCSLRCGPLCNLQCIQLTPDHHNRLNTHVALGASCCMEEMVAVWDDEVMYNTVVLKSSRAVMLQYLLYYYLPLFYLYF